jgi:hypothetical protein
MQLSPVTTHAKSVRSKNRVYRHLMACAAEYRERDRNPVVAWDQVAAASWAKACREFASEVVAMSDNEAMAYIKKRFAKIVRGTFQNGRTTSGLMMQIDVSKTLDTILDPIEFSRKGWIEVGTHGGLDDGKCSTRPGYRRMLGINHCIDFCGRQRGESDADWLKRRDAWLKRYNPRVEVSRNVFGVERQKIGTVAWLRKQEHLVEDERAARQIASAKEKNQ